MSRNILRGVKKVAGPAAFSRINEKRTTGPWPFFFLYQREEVIWTGRERDRFPLWSRPRFRSGIRTHNLCYIFKVIFYALAIGPRRPDQTIYPRYILQAVATTLLHCLQHHYNVQHCKNVVAYYQWSIIIIIGLSSSIIIIFCHHPKVSSFFICIIVVSGFLREFINLLFR